MAAAGFSRSKSREFTQRRRLGSMLSFKSFEDQLFDVLCDNEKKCVRQSNFIHCLQEAGLRKQDPRLKECMKLIQQEEKRQGGRDALLDKEIFRNCIKDNLALIKKAFTDDFVIPEFKKFTDEIEDMHENGKLNKNGKVATYIPQLARMNPEFWGVSICTVDGQRHSVGDTEIPFCLQSTSKPLTYALAVHIHGSDYVHNHVGQEPSGEAFNVIKLDPTNKPHNPMVNAGAIVTTSLIKQGSPMADKFDYMSQHFKKCAGGEYLGFNNAVFEHDKRNAFRDYALGHYLSEYQVLSEQISCTLIVFLIESYLSERETADRNFALGYYMQEKKCFPPGTSLQDTLDLYFQLCSIEVTCESGAVIASTLANGGICPLTGEEVLNGDAIRNCLSLMHSCGMYDYSGQFAFKVGLPAKSGVSGVILLVVPNVMGMCIWSPQLDSCGNSERGIKFCEELVRRFNFHHYDNLLHTRQKSDPRKRESECCGSEIVTLLFGAYNGDLSALSRMYLSGTDMGLADYDGRTALHLAAAEGHLDCVKFLLEKCKVNPAPEDRWGHIPYDDALNFKQEEIENYLLAFNKRRPSFVVKGSSDSLQNFLKSHKASVEA